ncbi:YfcE family phosphodiesterase [uncultured Tyzzerella sp.]|uniref:metallophosphoesterase family protein n=1 Tax=uncultured Tyzzerella sp. TaxID=2321398 RepID=UPI002943C207|nr:YfcE family phosphodiesterase [uncultured Tyzzerella sp.]
MKILVFSDSHANIKNMEKAIKMFNCEVSGIIHLGDYVEDVEKIKKICKDKIFLQVAGNNDFTEILNEKIVDINGHKVFLTHGHEYNVYFGIDRLYYRLNEIGVNIGLYGHTHSPFSLFENDFLILNPGSISYPRGFSVCTFLLMEFLDDVSYKFYGIFNDVIKEINQ